jgi:hypothetical protein
VTNELKTSFHSNRYLRGIWSFHSYTSPSTEYEYWKSDWWHDDGQYDNGGPEYVNLPNPERLMTGI